MAMTPKRNPLNGHCQCLQILSPKFLWRWNQPEYFFLLLYTKICLRHHFEKVMKWLQGDILGTLLTEL